MDNRICVMKSQTLPLTKDKPCLPPRPTSMVLLNSYGQKTVGKENIVSISNLPPTSTNEIAETAAITVGGNLPMKEVLPSLQKSPVYSENTDQLLKPAPSRPPPPATRPPPPATRPPRPYPPPTPHISEAVLVKKRPPPVPPLIIDSRSSPQHTPHSQRTFKVTSPTSPTYNENTPPKRPPLPVSFSPTGSNDQKSMNELPFVHESKPNEISVNAGKDTQSTVEAATCTDVTETPNTHTVLGRVKEKFRTFSTRRLKTVRSSNSSNSSHGSHDWKRVFTVRDTVKSGSANALEEDSKYPEKLPTGIVDPILVQCIAYLNKEEILKEPGLFRIPGDLSVIKRLRSQFIAGEEVDLSQIYDPNIITGLLKLYFRERPTALISNRNCIGRINVAVKNKDVQCFTEVLNDLDDVTVASLRMLSELFKKITLCSDSNHMTSGTLAASCGPSFFPNMPPSNANALLKFLSDNCDNIF